MGLSLDKVSKEAKNRKKLHQRTLDIQGFQRDDGLWDIEGKMIDMKSYAFANKDRGMIAAGEPLHEIHMRLTLDDEFCIHDVEAMIVHGPYAICKAITPRYKALIGIKIGPGWNRTVKSRFAKTDGCTHLTELLGPIATVAYQTIVGAKRQIQRQNATAKNTTNQKPTAVPPQHRQTDKKPSHLDGCHALDSKGPVVKRDYPEFYNG